MGARVGHAENFTVYESCLSVKVIKCILLEASMRSIAETFFDAYRIWLQWFSAKFIFDFCSISFYKNALSSNSWYHCVDSYYITFCLMGYPVSSNKIIRIFPKHIKT
jgi:hypothetical protein